MALLASLLALPGAALAQEQAPVVTNAVVTPGSLTHLGGSVTVTADVFEDSNALNDVWVDVSGPYFFAVALTQGSGTNEWFGTVELPANFTEEPVGWQFEVRARDLELAEGSGYAGEVTVDGQPQFDEPPVVYDPAVTPRDVPSGGGPVTLSVSAADLRGISEAYAVVTGPGAAATQVPLEPISSGRYEGIFDAPANTGTSPAQYAVEMVALDDIGQPGTADGGLITVAGQPAAGVLQLSRTELRYGGTTVGRRNRRSIVIRNVGPRSSPPVAGRITTSGSPFHVAGHQPANAARFCLRGGQSVRFRIEFRPTALGVRTGTLRVTRPDRVQPALSIPLSGRGVARPLPAILGTAPVRRPCA